MDDEDGPKSLVFKKYGGNVFEKGMDGKLKINSPLVQSLIFYEQSRRGWGPKLFGLFENGRVEEFVDSHTLTGAEAFTPEMIQDVSKAFARFHSHDLPINKEPHDMLHFVIKQVDKSRAALAEWTKSEEAAKHDLSSFPIDELLNFPFEKEWRWIEWVRSKIKQRIVFCALDNNYLNRLVRNKKPSDPNETQTLIIDYDTSAYSHRGFDIAGHFVCRLFDLSAEQKATKLPFPNDEEKAQFISSYLEECTKLFDDFDASSLDSIENVTLEVDFNLCAHLLLSVTYSLEMVQMIRMSIDAPSFIKPVMALHQQMKEEFLKKYPAFLL